MKTHSKSSKSCKWIFKNCLKVISDFYGKSFNEIVISKSVEIAEFSKLLENIYRSVNIGFINEMKIS